MPNQRKNVDPNRCANHVAYGGISQVFRWCIIVGCGVFVLRGFVYSYGKYSSKQTSLSFTKNETNFHTYPSVTLCHAMPGKKDVVFDILTQEIIDEFVDKGCNQSVLHNEIWKVGWRRRDFLQESLEYSVKYVFSHSISGGAMTGIGILDNDSYWQSSLPHVIESGVCFTYEPQFKSQSCRWYGIRIGIKLPDTEGLGVVDKADKLLDLYMFLHEKGKFTFHSPDQEFPDSFALDMSLLRYKMENLVSLTYGKSSSLPTEDKPCTNEAHYNFKQCVENFYSFQRGCQPPWLYNPEDGNILPPCHNLTHMKEWFARGEKGGKSFEYFHWHSNTPSELEMKTGCPQPCTVATFKPKFSYSSLQRHAYMGTDGDSEWVIHLAFDSFAFTYEREYLLCDWTCLLGEIGGNLGLFLGGSLLGFVDLIIGWGRKRVNWFKNLK